MPPARPGCRKVGAMRRVPRGTPVAGPRTSRQARPDSELIPFRPAKPGSELSPHAQARPCYGLNPPLQGRPGSWPRTPRQAKSGSGWYCARLHHPDWLGCPVPVGPKQRRRRRTQRLGPRPAWRQPGAEIETGRHAGTSGLRVGQPMAQGLECRGIIVAADLLSNAWQGLTRQAPLISCSCDSLDLQPAPRPNTATRPAIPSLHVRSVPVGAAPRPALGMWSPGSLRFARSRRRPHGWAR
jgi:hypothetical protein